MHLDELKSRLPAWARDLRLNLESVLTEGGAPGLTPKQIALVALASAVAARNGGLTAAMDGFAARHAAPAELDGARGAAALMGMTNVYYRFTQLVQDQEYATLRAGLRMNQMTNPGCSRQDYDLAAVAVSAINGCGSCVASHERGLRKLGVTAQAVQSAVRIAAVVHAVAVALEAAAVPVDAPVVAAA